MHKIIPYGQKVLFYGYYQGDNTNKMSPLLQCLHGVWALDACGCPQSAAQCLHAFNALTLEIQFDEVAKNSMFKVVIFNSILLYLHNIT